MLNPWIFGLEAMQQGWQAQTAMALTLMRSFGASASDQSNSIPLIQETVILEAQQAPAAIAVEQEAPAAVAQVRRRKAPTVLRVSKKLSRAKLRSASKRAAAASKKAVRRSARKPR